MIDWVGSIKMDQVLLDQMEEAGVALHRFRPLPWYNLGRMNNRTHRKLLVIDQEFVSVGSTNFDERSFRLNDEACLNIYERGFAQQMTSVFESDVGSATPYTLEMWEKRPLREKLAVRLLWPINSQFW